MEYNDGFIDKLLSSFHNSFMGDYDSWCDIARFEPSGSHYADERYQKVYALRYFPAYYLEYCILANRLRERVEGRYDYLRVSSFGCGLAPDYYALRDNLRDIAFDYQGYDHFPWATQPLVPLPDANFGFSHESITSLNFSDISNVDVFIFPKSIGDIASSAPHAMSYVSKLIASSPKARIFFLNSYVASGIGYDSSPDLKLFKIIHDELLISGFKTNDNWNKSRCAGDMSNPNGVGLRTVHYKFSYPSEYIITCGRKENVSLCNSCIVVKSPIFTNKFIDYQLVEYYR